MKRCPECRRDYYDDSLAYCLDDGRVLVDGPNSLEEPATAIQHDTNPIAESPTKIHFKTTEATAILPSHFEPKPNKSRRVAAIGFVAAFLAALIVTTWVTYRSYNSNAGGALSSIAVLPFENRSGNADADYLGDGLTDSLIFRFSQLPNLKVSPTSSVMQYKGTAKDVSQISNELGVDAVLYGRLVQLGDSLSVSVQLIDGRTKKLIWAEQYDRKMADLLATQREIATTITQKLRLNLAPDEKGITKKYTNSSEAYQLYLKGRYHWSRRTKEDLFKAIDSYKQAIDIDPNFALAYAAIAEAYNSMGKNPDAAPKDCIPLAEAAAKRALEIDPDLAEAHSALGDSLALYDWDWAGSEKHFQKAFEIDPNIGYTYVAHGLAYLLSTGQPEKAVSELERAVEMEPASLINNAVLTSAYIYARQNDKALRQAQKAYELDPAFPLAEHWLGMAYVANGRYDETIEVGSKMPVDGPLGWLGIVVVGHAHARMGKRTEAEAEIAKLRELAKTRYIRPYYIASIYAILGEKDKAFAELQKSFEEKDCYLGRVRVDPFFDPLREDPRFKELLSRMNLPL
jgi:TolB-like protein/Tfp pilus assembly protein PilF